MYNFSTSSVTSSWSAHGEPVGRILLGFALSLLVLWTLLGNSTVCAAVLRFRHLRGKVTNIFIVSLAMSDLLVAVLVMPWKAATEVAGHWSFGSFCECWVAFDIMCSTASILNLCVISVDRYWAISNPFQYERKMNRKVALVMVSATWIVSLAISFVPVQLNWHRADLGTFTASNSSTKEICDSSLSRTYAISSSLISFYIPVAVMVVTYTRIYRIAQVQIKKISSLERAAERAQGCRGGALTCPHHHRAIRETKLLKTLSVIMGVFVCCWLPFFILNCAVPFCHKPNCVSESTFNVFVWFGWCNSSINPIIYAFNSDFRDAFARLLCCHGLCTKAPLAIESKDHVSCNNQGSSVNTSMEVGYVSLVPGEADNEMHCPLMKLHMFKDESEVDPLNIPDTVDVLHY
ncbi:D(1) dopamine receptor [Myxocyprinus asiaticus]|uniref:D(1) dopamine receptor n=1 Tax=Myxocyprinus asiaticus TaxID=70543 RepID=UPI002223D322|nr:D(1) dopamine receptor [Myxocyprinus asiaticus]